MNHSNFDPTFAQRFTPDSLYMVGDGKGTSVPEGIGAVALVTDGQDPTPRPLEIPEVATPYSD